MLNQKHLKKLQQGIKSWNKWRSDFPRVIPQLQAARLRGMNLNGVDFHSTNLFSADLRDGNLRTADLRRADLCHADLRGADLHRADLTNAELPLAQFQGTNLSEAKFCWADLNGAVMRNSNLRTANLMHATLSEADLRFCDARGANFQGAAFTSAQLTKADLSATDLSEALFLEADLRHANLSYADLSDADFNAANLRYANLTANLERAGLVDTKMENSILAGCRIYGISAWNVRLAGAVQTSLIVTPEYETAVEVDGLEVAQFVYLILNNRKLRDVIDTIGKKAVLILGRFTAKRKSVLDAIRVALRSEGYVPILFDFEKPYLRDTQETIVTLAGLARFIIADITDPKSIPQELASVVPNFPSVPVQPLIQKGSEPWRMYDHIKRYDWVLPIYVYRNQRSLLKQLAAQVIGPAETQAKQCGRK